MLNKDIITISLTDLEQLLKDGMSPDNGTEPFKNSPLCFACMYNRTDIALLLINAGADVNFPGFHGRTPLFYAADKGNIELAEALYKKGADVNYINKDGKNILMDIAIHKPGAEMVKWLISNGCDINHHYTKYTGDAARIFESRADYNKHRSILKTAVYCDAVEMVKVLIEHGADGAENGWHKDAFMLSLEGYTDEIALWLLSNHTLKYPDHEWLPDAYTKALTYRKQKVSEYLLKHQLIRLANEDFYYSDAKRVEKFLEDGFPPDNDTKPGDDSPLCYACMYNKTDVARLLVEAGADVRFKGSYGRTPIMYAASKNNTELCKLLLEKGADINATNDAGDNILMDIGQTEKLSGDTIRWLISSGIDINYGSEKRKWTNYRNELKNWTVLDPAAQSGNPELVKILIEYGADNARDHWHEDSFVTSLRSSHDEELSLDLLKHYKGSGIPGGIVALNTALEFRKTKTVKRMLQLATEKEKTEWSNSNGLANSIWSMVYHDNLELCRLLLDEGIDINKTTLNGSPLQTAARYGKTDFVKLFLKYGAKAEEQDFEGNTALILAAHAGHVELMKLLLEAGADIHTKNKMGWTALMQASLFRQPEAMKFLLEQGADANDKAVKERNITALMLACDSGIAKSVNLLLKHGADPFTKDDIGLTAHKYAEFAMPFKKDILDLLPPLPASAELTEPLPKVDLKGCPVCKGIGDYEHRKVSGWGEDYRKYFFKVLNLIEEGPEVHEGYKYYTRTSYYQCPRCDSQYKKRESEDMDNFPTQYELEVWRISDSEVKK